MTMRIHLTIRLSSPTSRRITNSTLVRSHPFLSRAYSYANLATNRTGDPAPPAAIELVSEAVVHDGILPAQGHWVRFIRS
jgi:hypothetical protein